MRSCLQCHAWPTRVFRCIKDDRCFVIVSINRAYYACDIIRVAARCHGYRCSFSTWWASVCIYPTEMGHSSWKRRCSLYLRRFHDCNWRIIATKHWRGANGSQECFASKIAVFRWTREIITKKPNRNTSLIEGGRVLGQKEVFLYYCCGNDTYIEVMAGNDCIMSQC